MNNYRIIAKDLDSVVLDIRGEEVCIDKLDLETISEYDGELDVLRNAEYGPRVVFRFRDNYLINAGKLILDKTHEDDRVVNLDNNPLNLRRHNLKYVDKSESYKYRDIHANNTSGYPGVSWLSSRERWRVVIKGRYYGSFKADDLDKAIELAKSIRES